MEQKIEIPDFGEGDEATVENIDPAAPTLACSEDSEDWEKISEDWVSLFLDTALLGDQSRSLESYGQLQNSRFIGKKKSWVPLQNATNSAGVPCNHPYSQFDTTLPETNDRFSSQDLLADSMLLPSIDDPMSHGDLVFGSTCNVVEDLFGKKDYPAPQVDFIGPKWEPTGATSSSSSVTQLSGGSSTGMETDLWKEKDFDPDLSITLKRSNNETVSSGSDSPTFPSTGGDSQFANNQLQGFSCKEGEAGSRDKTPFSFALKTSHKKVYVDELEGKLRTMTASVAELNATISHLSVENVNLRRQLGYYFPAPGVCPRRPGMSMHVLPMGPYPGTVARRPMFLGGQMPPVPIPRMKTQTPARSSKGAKSGATKEGGDKKRTKLKAAGAASMAVMGLLCVAMVFGSLEYGTVGVDDYSRLGNMGVVDRVLTSWNGDADPLNNTGFSEWDYGPGWAPLKPGEHGPEREGVPSIHAGLAFQTELEQANAYTTIIGFGSSVRSSIDRNATLATSTSLSYFSSVKSTLQIGSEVVPANTSQSFAAFVFIPGANGLVKVDGTLIIQAVMARDKAAKKQPEKKSRSVSKKENNKQVAASAVKKFPIKALDNLASREFKVVKNPSTGPFVTARPLSGKVNSVVETSNPVSPMLRAASLQQRMLGGLQDPETAFLAKELTTKAQRHAELPVDNLKAVGATGRTFYSFTPYDAAPRGPLNSWLFSGLSTGPVLSTGMCTELFQFDTGAAAATTSPGQVSSPEPKTMAESVAAQASQGSSSSRLPHNVTTTSSFASVPVVVPRSRRDPFAVPLPPIRPKPSAREECRGNGTDPRVETTVREQLHQQNLRHGVSSMVVSVLAGPDDYAGDSSSRRKGTAKGFSWIFVVVLVDNQKYVSYSCMLPSGGYQAHVVVD